LPIKVSTSVSLGSVGSLSVVAYIPFRAGEEYCIYLYLFGVSGTYPGLKAPHKFLKQAINKY